MAQIIFNNADEEEDHKAGLLRNPRDVEELQDFVTNRKTWLDTCDFCLRRAEEELAISPAQSSLYTCDDDDVKRVPISTLLPELLVIIFLFLTQEDPPRIQETWDASYTRMMEVPHLGWIQATHVCRRWQAVAISAAVLWTDLCQGAVLGPLWTRVFISRAKCAGVTIRRFEDYPKSSEMLGNYILDHPAHLRHVDLSTEWTPFYILDEYTYTWSSMLVSVDLDGGIGHYFAPPLFGGYAPNLRRLKLSNIQPWRCSHHLLSGLVELHVFLSSSFAPDMTSGDPDPILIGVLPSISQTLDVLDEAPMLQRLALHYAFPSDDLPVIDRRKVSLNHVQELSLSAKIVDCLSFFTRVAVPCNATLDLTCIPGLHVAKFRDLFRIVTDRLASIGDEPSTIFRLEIGTGKPGDICLLRAYADSYWAYSQNVENKQRCDLSSKPFITLSLAYATITQHIDVLQQFFATVPLHDLSYLTIYGCWHIDPDGWRTITRESYVYLQSVRLLVLNQDCAQYFFHAIHDGGTSTPGLRPLAFPNLEALMLRNVDFSAFSCALDEVSFQEQMLSHLRGRAAGGRMLRVLVFISCQGIDQSWLANLRSVAHIVTSGF